MHRQRNIILRVFFLIIIGLIIHGSFFPWRFSFRPPGANPLWTLVHSWPTLITRSIVRDIGVNIAVYFPLGVAGYLAFATFRARWMRQALPVLTGACLSVSVECLQQFQELRVCSMLDVICNVLGSAAGVAFAAAIDARMEQPWIRNLLRRADVLLIGGGWLAWQLFPMVPVWKWSLLQRKLETVMSWSGGAGALATAFTGWLIAACIIQALGVTPTATRMMAMAAAIVPLRIIIHGHVVGLPEIAGVAAAVCVWRFGLARQPFRTRIAGTIAIGYLCMRQLVPFSVVPGAESFLWIPFTASLEGDSLEAFMILIEKMFLYSAPAAVLWWSGITLRRSATLVVSTLAITEALQTCMPGRVPEITDPFIALLAAVTLGMVSRIAAGEVLFMERRTPDLITASDCKSLIAD